MLSPLILRADGILIKLVVFGSFLSGFGGSFHIYSEQAQITITRAVVLGNYAARGLRLEQSALEAIQFPK